MFSTIDKWVNWSLEVWRLLLSRPQKGLKRLHASLRVALERWVNPAKLRSVTLGSVTQKTGIDT